MSATTSPRRPPFVVVGVDGYPASDAALEWALAEAQARELQLELVGVWQAPLVVAGPSSAIAVPTLLRVARHHVDQVVDLAAKRAADAGVPANAQVLEGHPAEVLLALSGGADQTVVGARDGGRASRFPVGSVSAAVAHHAVVPVTVVRRQSRPVRRRLAVGVDGSPGSRAALRRAAVEARATAAELQVVVACGRESSDPQVRALLDREAEHMNGCRIRVDEVRGHPVDVLLAAAERADLLVVGTRGLGAFDRMLLGSVSTACLHHATCPIQIVPA